MKTFTLHLHRLHVHRETENDGDELFLKYNQMQIAPVDSKFYKNNPEHRIDVNTSIELDDLGQWIEIELWEYDFLLPNTRLGSFKLLADKTGGPYTADLMTNDGTDARYSLSWEVKGRLTASL
jgi:hypothetical protein